MSRKLPIKPWAIAAGAAFTLLLVGATLPMRLVLDGADAGAAGLTARSVSGSIWNGRLVDAQMGALPLGHISAWLAPLSLLSGDRVVQIRRLDVAQGPLEGRFYAGAAKGFADVTGQLPLSLRVGPVALSQVELNKASLRFDRQGRCVAAGGTAKLGLSSPIAGLTLQQGLTGPLRCAGGAAQLALVSQSGLEKLTLTLSANGAWRARFAVEGVEDAAMQAGLMAMGFQAAGDGYVLVASGGA